MNGLLNGLDNWLWKIFHPRKIAAFKSACKFASYIEDGYSERYQVLSYGDRGIRLSTGFVGAKVPWVVAARYYKPIFSPGDSVEKAMKAEGVKGE